MSTNAFAFFAALLTAQAPTTGFYHDFRGGKPLPAELTLFGPDASEFVTSELEGLRLTLPTAGPGGFGWGVALKFTVAGDFEVTGSYELLRVVPPLKSFGAGVALNALPRYAGDKFAKIGRFVQVTDKNVYVAQFFDKLRPQDNRNTTAPTATQSGQLRLTRKNGIMHFLAAGSIGGEFREIAAWEFGPEDLSMVRFIANNNGSPTAVDVRLLDLKVTGSLVPLAAAPVEMPVAAPIEKPRFPFAWIIGLIVAALLIAVGVRLMLRRRGIAGQGTISTTGDG